jgi:NAD-dependent deacetylase
MTETAKVASWVREARAVAVITGAGISAESGVPTFRGVDGLWRSFRPEDLATPQAFARDPRMIWDWYRWRRGRIAGAVPNPGHDVLARLESRVTDYLLLTQNVDGLHARAGSRQLVELHGNIWRARCTENAAHVFDETPPSPDGERATPRAVGLEAGGGGAPPALNEDDLPRCPSCGALLRPDVVWFGEALDGGLVDRALAAVRSCEVLLLVGTSGVVYPVAGLPSIARHHGARVVEINVEPTPLSEVADVVLRGPAGTWLPAIEAAL